MNQEATSGEAGRGLGAAPCSATYNFKDHPQTTEQLREKAEALWQLLDDISTAFDMAKPKLEWFEKYVWGKCEQRSKHFQSDGYKLYATNQTTIGLEALIDQVTRGLDDARRRGEHSLFLMNVRQLVDSLHAIGIKTASPPPASSPSCASENPPAPA